MTAPTSRATIENRNGRDARRRMRAVPWADLSRLLDQQLWCWDRDRRAGLAVPVGRCGNAAVDIAIRPDGIWVKAADAGRGTLVLRNRPGPFVAAPDTTDDAGAGLMRHPADDDEAGGALADMAALCRWIAGGEWRTLCERGAEYRRNCLQALHPSRHYCAPGALAGCWRAWASLMEQPAHSAAQ